MHPLYSSRRTVFELEEGKTSCGIAAKHSWGSFFYDGRRSREVSRANLITSVTLGRYLRLESRSWPSKFVAKAILTTGGLDVYLA